MRKKEKKKAMDNISVFFFKENKNLSLFKDSLSNKNKTFNWILTTICTNVCPMRKQLLLCLARVRHIYISH